MKKLFLSIVIALFFNSLFAQTKWVKVWSEEFNTGSTPNPEIWRYDVGNSGWGNQELQYYTANRKENSRIENGNLVIETKKETYNGSNYTSARLKTMGTGDWKYGKFEIKAKIPQGRGVWPAIWLLPTENIYGNWPKSGEIDIMEYVGYEPNTIYATIHTENYNHELGTQIGTEKRVEKPFNEFHIYGLEWFEDSLVFLFDNERFYKIEKNSDNPANWPFDQNFHLIINTAVGGTWGGAQGIDTSIFPQQMLVDYIRVYKNVEEKEAYNFTLYQESGGEVISNVENGSHPQGTNITIEAKPIEEYQFVGWNGTIQSTKNPLSFPLDLDVSVTPKYKKSNELLINGDFTHGFMDWLEHNYTDGSNSSTDQKICFNVPNKATYPWDVQLSQQNLNLKEGAKYELSFFASSTSDEKLIVSAGLSQDPWTTYFNENFTLDEELKIYTMDFVVNEKLSESDRLTFDVGNLKGETCIDNVSLLLIETPLSTETIEEKEVPMFKIYPTKISGTTTIMTVSSIKSIEIVTENGKKINSSKYKTEILSSRLAKIKWTDDLKSGVYLVKTSTEKGVHIDKLVKD